MLRRPFLSWLQSPLGWVSYSLGWAAFSVGFAALFWFPPKGSLGTAMGIAIRIMGPAAILGVVVVAISARWDPIARPSIRNVSLHVLSCLVYPALWVGIVSGTQAFQVFWNSGVWQWTVPRGHVLHWHYLAGVLIYSALGAITWGFNHALRAEQGRRRAESQLLRAQLNPHFLFNTLHALFSLAQTDPGAGEEGLQRFSQLLRYTLRVHRDDVNSVSLEEEWNFTSAYLTLEALRLGERLRWQADISEDAREARVPPLILQPLVENAVRYAVMPRVTGGNIAVRAHFEGTTLILNVRDDGPGCVLGDEKLSSGVGLRSVRTRLEALSNGESMIAVDTAPGRGFSVTLAIPEQAARLSEEAVTVGGSA